MVDQHIHLKGLTLRNPVMTASGTFGFGEEFTDYLDLARIGGIIVKGTTFVIVKVTLSPHGRDGQWHVKRCGTAE
jgi:dihydroorotate dehydrogenase